MALLTKVLLLCTLTASVIAVPVIQNDGHHAQEYHPIEDLNAAAEYDYHYSVNNEKTGDIKAHKESRDKDGLVKGSYMFIEADGHKRVVTYIVHKDSGFVANVNREKVSGYKAPEVHYEAPKPQAALPQQLPSFDLSQYEQQFHEESVKALPAPVKYQEQEYKPEPEQPAQSVQPPSYATEEKHDLTAFLQQHQLPNYESEYKQQEEYKPAEHKYEHYQLPEYKEAPSKETTEAPATQYEQQNNKKEQTAPQQFFHAEQAEAKSDEEPKYEVKHEEPKYEVKSFKYEEPKYQEKYEQPKYEVKSFKYEEPKYQVKYEEPKYETKSFKYEEPKYQEKYEEPKYETKSIKYEEPKYEEPKYEKPKFQIKVEDPKQEEKEVKYEQPKFEAKYEQPQIKYIFIQKPVKKVEKQREPVILKPVPQQTEEEIKVKPYRFAPLENLYKFVIGQAKTFDGAEPAPDFLQ